MRKKATFLMTTAFLATPAAAGAQETGYGATTGVQDPSGPAELPFTGADTAALVAAGCALLVAGALMRRRGRA